MKIAFIVNSFPKLSETFILNQVTGLLDLGHEVEIFAFKKPNEKKVHPDVQKYDLLKRAHYITIPNNKIKRIFYSAHIVIKNFGKHPIIILSSLNFFKYKKRALSLSLLSVTTSFLNKKFDVIHCHFGSLGIWGAILKDIGICDSKIVTSFHGYDMSRYILKNGRNAYDYLFKNGDLFLPISKYWKNKLIELGCDENKIFVYRMGIDINKFNYRERKNNNKTVDIITIGRLVEKKGIEYGIRAVANIIREFPNIKYNIIGDGPLRSTLNNLIIDLGLKEKVQLLGSKAQGDVIGLLYGSDILLAPSVTAEDGDQEGIPVVLMEAMATGLPIISTKHTGIPELVLDGDSGLLVNEKDVESIGDKLKYLIVNPEKRITMGIVGRKIIEKSYNIDILKKQLSNIYNR
jgi:colanic acid/amylovoran biosynthesis glycosyltransferase